MQTEKEVSIQYVQMTRTSDGDGPHPIHPDEVENYKQGGWTIVVPTTLTEQPSRSEQEAQAKVDATNRARMNKVVKE